MGSLHSQEYAANEGLTLLQSVTIQLRNNHYPPVPTEMIPVAIRAIRYGRRGKFESNMTLPVGVTYKSKGYVPVQNILESYHLWDWVE